MKRFYMRLESKNLSEQEGNIYILSDEESRTIVGGIQPQPLPPGISSALIQPQKILLQSIVIGSIVIGS